MKRVENNKTTSIKRTLLLGMVGMTVTVSILFGIAAGTVLYQNSSQNMKNEVSLATKAYSQSVQNKIEQYKISIEQIATNDTITANSFVAVNIRSTKERLAKQYGFLSVNIADEAGKTDVDGVNISDEEYFKQALSGKTYISSPVISKINKKQVVYVSAKINNASEYNGVVFASLAVDTFSSMVDNASIGSTGYSFITNKSGTIIAHKERSNVTNSINYIEKSKKDNSFSGAASVVEKMIAGKAGSQSITLNGAEQYIGYTQIPDTDGWSIGVAAKTSEMMSGFYTSIFITLALMILFIALSCFFSFRIATPIANPIIALVHRIESLAEGDLHSEVPKINSNNEVSILSDSFSHTVNTLNQYVSEISSVLSSLSQGDCTVYTQQNYTGDFIAIKAALDSIVSNFNSMFTKISHSANQVSSGSEQVSNASQVLSQGATEQASSIEELSASLTEIADEVNKNASNASNANQLSMEASAEVERGNKQMQQMIKAMTDISDSSKQISKIIKAIEDIAFQTNILALNAAVEAARAGAAGKGFAVVADEVRNLASKSAEAAKNTTVLIENSIKAVENGTKIANETAKSLQVIIDTTNKSTELISEISSASNHQANSINEITSGVDQISAVVQMNSATSEESAATSEELSGQAQILKNMLSTLKLKVISEIEEPAAQDIEGKISKPFVAEPEPNKYSDTYSGAPVSL